MPTGPAVVGLPVAFFVILCLLVAAATVYGLVAEEPYRSVPDLLQETWRAQDAATLACVPWLVWATTGARRSSVCAHVGCTGILMWLSYCYAHLSLGTPMNDMFLVYVAILSMASFGTLDQILRVDVDAVGSTFRRAPRRAASAFLAIAGVGMAVLWLSDIALHFTGGTPANLHLAGLPNPTWVLDLGWLIPLAVASAVMLQRGHRAGTLVAGTLLVMLLILSVAMLMTAPFGLAAGLGDDAEARRQLIAFTVVFAVLGILEAALVAVAIRRRDPSPQQWRRPSWWSAPAPRRSPRGGDSAARSA